MKYLIIFVLSIFLLCSCAPAAEQSDANSGDTHSDIEIIDESEKAHENLKAVLYASDKDFDVDVDALFASGTDRGFAKEKHLPEYQDFFKNLDISTVTAFNLTALPSMYQNDFYILDKDEAVEILSKFKEFEPGILPESEYDNVLMGGGWEWYIATESGDWLFSYNGLWLTICDCQNLEKITYTLEYDDEFWNEMYFLMDTKLVDTFGLETEDELTAEEPPTNPNPDTVTDNSTGNSGNSGNSGSSNSTASSANAKSFISLSDIETLTIFNNREKTCTPEISSKSQDTKDLIALLKYENFTNYNSNKAVSDKELGAPMEPFDTVEFARTDGKKYTLKLYEGGFELSGSAVKNKDKKVWLAEPYSWNQFIRIAADSYLTSSETIPSWLGLINRNNVTSASAESSRYTVDRYPLDKESLVSLLKNTAVTGEVKTVKKSAYRWPEEYINVYVNFYTGNYFTVVYSCSEVTVISADTDYALTYQLKYLDSEYQRLLYYFAPQEVSTEEANPSTAKPVIYLYPEKTTDIAVNLDFDGVLTYTYPALGKGWKVTANPDGSLVNKADGSLLRYLFWEGRANYDWKIEKGFVVAGKDTETFLVSALTEMGLNSYEIADFVTYWAPRMVENEYNLISFSGNEYSEVAKLSVNPKPDSMIRIHMVWKGLEKPVEIAPQVLPSYERKGFTLVEWGGTEIE